MKNKYEFAWIVTNDHRGRIDPKEVKKQWQRAQKNTRLETIIKSSCISV